MKSFAYSSLPGAAAGAVLAFSLLIVGSPPAAAMTIEKVVSPGGIEAWLVHDSTLPLIALDFAIRGSADQDPADKPGVANLATSLLDEGAGPYDSAAFHDRLERKAIELNFRAGRDYLRGTLRTLKENRDEAFGLLRLSLTEPRLEAADIERMRADIMSRLQRESVSPQDIAGRNWWATAFPGHPYGRSVNGTLESVPRITADDLKAYVGRVLGRANLKVAIVGDIDALTAASLLDRTFGGLRQEAELTPVPAMSPEGLGRRVVIPLDVPQAVVNFGGPGVFRSDPDFMAAYIVSYILGGGSFSSRLYSEVREKRGLAYGISQSLVWLRSAAVLIGTTATRADATAQTIEIIQREIARMAEEGPTQEEFEKAKSYLKGSYALGLDTSTRIASQLVQIQIDNLGIDYIERRGDLIDAVSLADCKRAAQRLLNGLLITVVGRPPGLTSTEVLPGGAPTQPGRLQPPAGRQP
ncbi:MAG: M16 family metallopeptidase [Xanthobacteraceae bacterium]